MAGYSANWPRSFSDPSRKKLINEDLLLTSFAAIRLRMEIDKIPLWRGNHVPVKQLIEDMWRYLYLPRLLNKEVLLKAIDDGCSSINFEQEGFALAYGYNEAKAAKKQFAEQSNSKQKTTLSELNSLETEKENNLEIENSSKAQIFNNIPTRYHANR